jgi:hypothetical protein
MYIHILVIMVRRMKATITQIASVVTPLGQLVTEVFSLIKQGNNDNNCIYMA